jgi:DNA-binding NtrC family response regulator
MGVGGMKILIVGRDDSLQDLLREVLGELPNAEVFSAATMTEAAVFAQNNSDTEMVLMGELGVDHKLGYHMLLAELKHRLPGMPVVAITNNIELREWMVKEGCVDSQGTRNLSLLIDKVLERAGAR